MKTGRATTNNKQCNNVAKIKTIKTRLLDLLVLEKTTDIRSKTTDILEETSRLCVCDKDTSVSLVRLLYQVRRQLSVLAAAVAFSFLSRLQ